MDYARKIQAFQVHIIHQRNGSFEIVRADNAASMVCI